MTFDITMATVLSHSISKILYNFASYRGLIVFNTIVCYFLEHVILCIVNGNCNNEFLNKEPLKLGCNHLG